MARIALTTIIRAPAERCFEQSLSVEAHNASLASSDERVVDGVQSGVMVLGDSVTWQARHLGVTFSMCAQVTEYERPTRFVDEQVAGPFKFWRHEHRFEQSEGATVMTDVVDFASACGVLGRSIDAVFLTGYMTRLLERRNSWLASNSA